MKAAVLHGVGDIRVEDVPKPALKPDEVLVEVKACGICGTDLHFYHGEWAVKPPLIPGHEFAGVVSEVGSRVTQLQVGDRVAVDPNIACGECHYCRQSERNYFCENLEAIGVTRNGAFAQYVNVPAKATYPIPEQMTFLEGAFVEPVACCIRGIDNAQITVGDNIAIIGAGPIGLLHLQLAKLSGAAKAVVIDLVPERLEAAKKLGADFTVNAREEDPVEAVESLTDGRRADVVIEAVGSIPTVEQAFELAGRGAHVNLFGCCPEGDIAKFSPFNHMYTKELTVTAAFRNPFTFQRAIRVLANKRIQVDLLVTHQLPVDQFEKALEIMDKKLEGAVKLLLLPNP